MPQDYPRTAEGFLDESRLAPHTSKIPFDELKAIISDAIASAARKSRREILASIYRLKCKRASTMPLQSGTLSRTPPLGLDAKRDLIPSSRSPW